MLLQYSCQNYRSIREEITFSMRKAVGEVSQNRTMKHNGAEIESVSVIYGANGSGKSNFISSVGFAKFMVETSIMFQPGQEIRILQHKLSSMNELSSFDFQFTVDSIRYAYGFSVVKGEIEEEYLYYFPNNRQTKIFERNGLQIISGSRYKHSFGVSREVLHKNRLFLSCAANYSRVFEVQEAFKFFSQGIVIYRVNVDEPRMNNWYEYTVSLMRDKPEVKKKFLEVLTLLGTGIVDIKAEQKIFSAEEITQQIPSPLKEIILTPEVETNGLSKLEAKMVYPEFETDLLTEEGTGIQKLFQMICPLLDILEKGKVIFCDELETGLHEAIVHKVIELFYSLKPDSEAQMIFTTHDTSLLSKKLFRRGQIWFTELTPRRSTDLYSLAEVKNVRKDENIEHGYMSGKYGAVPILNRELIERLMGGRK